MHTWLSDITRKCEQHHKHEPQGAQCTPGGPRSPMHTWLSDVTIKVASKTTSMKSREPNAHLVTQGAQT